MKISTKIILILFVLLANTKLKAQLLFPKGSTINTVSSEDLMYAETRILFTTGKFISSDYKFEKLSDSLDQRWFVTSCFNGDCKNDLTQTGQFLKDFGINDTTCFIAFHVESKGNVGTSVIKYKVFNSKNTTDFEVLTFNISYAKPNATLEIMNQKAIQIFPNPVSDYIEISKFNNDKTSITIYNSFGKIMDELTTVQTKTIFTIDKNKYTNGVYFIKTEYPNTNSIQKFLVN